MPIEFARVSNDGRVTLVIVNDGKTQLVRTLWALMGSTSVKKAVESLRVREGTTTENIGKASKGEQASEGIKKIILPWMKAHNLDHLIWTNLPPKFGEGQEPPTFGELDKYLTELNQNKAGRAWEYIRNAPRQIMTSYRRQLYSKYPLK